jgi:hypothetical protein
MTSVVTVSAIKKLQEQPRFHDSSGKLFSLYSRISEEEDDKMTDLWQQEATNGILVFVSPHGLHSCYYAHKLEHSGYRPVYCLPLSPPCLLYPSRISGQTLRTPPHSISRVFSGFLLTQTSRYHAHPSLHHSYTTPVLSTDIRRLGEFTLVLELCNQSRVCSLGYVATSMCTSIHQRHSAGTMQPREASANACIICQRCAPDTCSLGS